MKAEIKVQVTRMSRHWRRGFIGGFLLALGMGFGPLGCSTTQKTGSDASAHEETHANTPLELNQGKKWVVDKPMMAHLRNVEKAVQDSERTLTRNDAVLGAEIQEHLGRLVTNCTMKGKAHDELHKWLVPFVGLSGEYANTTDPQVQREKFQEIKNALVVFNEYFE
jgi:hypothetical protein